VTSCQRHARPGTQSIHRYELTTTCTWATLNARSQTVEQIADCEEIAEHRHDQKLLLSERGACRVNYHSMAITSVCAHIKNIENWSQHVCESLRPCVRLKLRCETKTC
jgi:hypothetical protein